MAEAGQERALAGEAGRLLDAQGVADRLATTRSTAYRLMAAGAFPTVRWGGTVRARVGDVDAWVARQVIPARHRARTV